MPSASTRRRHVQHFKPSQLVLCRYETYPYWPAKINNMFPSEVTEGYRCQLETKEGIFYFYWCMFCNEEKGGWIREDRIVLFHPSLVKYVRVSSENSWYQEQQKALRAAFKFYNALHSKALPPKPSEPIPDLLEAYRCGNNLPSAEDSVTAIERNGKKEAKVETVQNDTDKVAKEETSVLKEDELRPSSSQRITKKRSLQVLEGFESEEKQSSQKQRLSDLLTHTARPGLDTLGESAEVTFFAPPPPEDYPAALPDKGTYHSRPANASSFSEMMKDLRHRISAYNESSKDAEEAHHIFDVEKENIRRKYKDLFERLGQVERRAADEKKYLVMLLQDILQARVDIADLKRHRAGTIIKLLGKDCEDVPAIHTLCEEIAKVWAEVVDLYVTQYRESL